MSACPCFTRSHFAHSDHCCLRDLDIDQIAEGMPLPCGHDYAATTPTPDETGDHQ